MRVRATMPDDLQRRPRAWWFVVLGYLAIAVHAIIIDVPHQRADMTGAICWIGAELVALCALWAKRGEPPGWLRAGLTACVGVPGGLVVAFLGVFGDSTPGYEWSKAPAALHVWWIRNAIGWTIVVGVVAFFASELTVCAASRSASPDHRSPGR
jgi:hypothetical protein